MPTPQSRPSPLPIARAYQVAASSWSDASQKIDQDMPKLVDMCGCTKGVVELVGDCIVNEVGCFLTSRDSADKTADKVLDDWVKILQELEALATRLPDSQEFHNILLDTRVVLEASMPDTKVAPGDLSAAKLRLQSPAGAKAWQLWFGSPAGCVVVADADIVLAASALDDQCAEDRALASAYAAHRFP